MKPTDKYRYCNHHHELTEDQEIVDLGTGPFVADKQMLPLLRALNDIGLPTRTHNYSEEGGFHFISILLEDHIDIEITTVKEVDADRSQFDGKKELLIRWNHKPVPDDLIRRLIRELRKEISKIQL